MTNPRPPGGDPLPARIRGAVLSYEGRRVLDGVNLDLDPGSIYVLLGRNGVGKTSLIRVLCGRAALDQGQVTVLGRDPRRDRAVRRAISFVPQGVALYPKLTVRENLAAFAGFFGGRGLSLAACVERVMRAIAVADIAGRRVGELSGGYQRRVNLGAALVSEPSILLLDEPTVGLDAGAKDVLVDVVRSLAKGGTSILLTTHDHEVATALADRVGVLAAGKIVVEGRPGDLLTRHFEGRAKVDLVLRHPAAPPLAATFEELGLTSARDGRHWGSVALGVAGEAVATLLAALASTEQAVQTLRIEKPGLEALCDWVAPAPSVRHRSGPSLGGTAS